MINGNDGGATISVDGGRNWSTQNNQPTAQFYHVTADNDFPYHIYGTQQDNSSVGIATASDNGFIGRSDWDAVGGGESGYVAVDPRDSNIVYAGSYFGDITRYDKRTQQVQNIQQWPLDPDGYNAAVQKYRYTWTMPIVFSPHDPNELYHSSQYLFRSTDGGHSWQTISPDLTRNDKSKQQDSGGPITKDQASIEFYDLIFTVAESPKQKGVIWVGTDDGLIQLTRDDGRSWSNVTPKGLPEWAMVSLIEPSPFDAGTAYAAVDAHKLDNYKPYIFKTTDFGKTWTSITTGLPDNSYVHAVREDPKRKGMLYAGTETGIWVSFDDGSHWQSLQLDLPTTPIHDLIIHDDDLVVATHGRSFWSLDNIDPLRQMKPGIMNEDARLFAPSTVVRSRVGHSKRRREPSGENPAAGASLYYYLKEEVKEPTAKLEILDAQGKVIRTYTSEESKTESAPEEGDKDDEAEHISTKAGPNVFLWDLRYEPPTKIPAAIYDEGEPVGPLVMPGSYQARLTVKGKTSTAPIEVKMDPRLKTSTEDLQKQFDLMMKLRDRQEQMNRAILAIRDLRVQLNLVEKRWGSKDNAKAVIEQSVALRKKIGAIEDELIQVNSKASEDELNYPTKMNSWLGYLQAAVDSADAQPTEGELAVFADLNQKLDAHLAKWHEVLSTDVPAINEAMHKNGIAFISAAPEATNWPTAPRRDVKEAIPRPAPRSASAMGPAPVRQVIQRFRVRGIQV